MVEARQPLLGDDAISGVGGGGGVRDGLSFAPVTLCAQDLWYTVTLKTGESIDLLKDINAYFKPQTMTALMGSSGAGR